MRRLRIIIGLTFWCGLLGFMFWAGWQDGSSARRLAPDLWQYTLGERHIVELQFSQPTPVAIGDPIFVIDGPAGVRQIGEIRTVLTADPHDPRRNYSRSALTTMKAEALFYPNAPADYRNAELLYYAPPDSMHWVIETMFPQEKKEQIAQELRTTFEQHHEEVLASLRPVFEASLRESLLVVEQELAASLERHHEELEQLGDKYQQQIVQEKLIPLMKEEIWPIVLRRAEPTVKQVGKEMWDRASVWRFGWRYVYDKSPLPERKLTKKEWSRFLDEDAAYVLQNHTNDFIRVQQQILADVADNAEVREAIRSSLMEMITDSELQQLAWKIIREAMIDNPRLAEVLEKHWNSPAAKQALQLAEQRLEPTVRRIGTLLFGDPETGITPEFARVLRNQILQKDRRWFVLAFDDTPSALAKTDHNKISLKVRRGVDKAEFPFAKAKGDSATWRQSR